MVIRTVRDISEQDQHQKQITKYLHVFKLYKNVEEKQNYSTDEQEGINVSQTFSNNR